ncbi:uncharacterized protein LOC113371061 [Ctenocephalides felis]|uniref:uncharacterized protein LOC113371061 n=1 Tax=Ctenocephalides felis TaxID=7515 RepID=UPI000E6E3025|nr:uncharacterized protein LOC113371061 [Ctenocephalides felis]
MERVQVRPVDEIVEENYVTCPSEFRPIGRGCDYTNNLAKINNKLNCICYRNKSRFVLCRNCGHIMNGRKRLTCPDHPRIAFLMDHQICLRCKVGEFMLKEIDGSRQVFVAPASKIEKKTVIILR